MKAVIINQFGGPEKLEYVELAKPEPGLGEVLVKNIMIGYSKTCEMVRNGTYPYLKKQPPNLTLGNECAGYVEAVGADVSNFQPGDPVWVLHTPGYGAYAEYICVSQKFVRKLPTYIPPENAPGLMNYFSAYAFLNDAARGTDAKSLYILGGAGGIGTALIKIALLQGWEVISAARTQKECDYLTDLGTTHVFNSIEKDQCKEVLSFTHGRGVDLIFDQLVGPKFYDQFKMLADFGMIFVYNWLQGTPGEDFFPHMVSQAIHAGAIRFFSGHIYDDKPERAGKLREKLYQYFESGQLKNEITTTYPLCRARELHEMLANGGVVTGKVGLIP